MKRSIIIGISDSRNQWFPPHVEAIIRRGHVFSGGKRHHEIVGECLPADSVWIDITVPLSAVFEQYKQYDDVVIFVSGDPLFYGFASTVMRELPECEITVIPSFNSLQMLAHRMCLPYQDMHAVSLTGRPWDKFDEALIRGEELIGVLTDKVRTPHAIAERMEAYGYTDYRMTIGENLGNEESERISEYNAKDTYAIPNCIILRRTSSTRPSHARLGIPESEFHLLNGRAKMITKMPIRLLTLSMLDLHNKQSFWDVGFCTGSISIEAKLQFPHLRITAFEIREEGRMLMEQNSKRFGAPGIQAIVGDFLQADVSQLPPPDAVFIGGHGGHLQEMVQKIHSVLLPGGCIVFNSVSADSLKMFEESIASVGMQIASTTQITIDEHNPIKIIKAQ